MCRLFLLFTMQVQIVSMILLDKQTSGREVHATPSTQKSGDLILSRTNDSNFVGCGDDIGYDIM